MTEGLLEGKVLQQYETAWFNAHMAVEYPTYRDGDTTIHVVTELETPEPSVYDFSTHAPMSAEDRWNALGIYHVGTGVRPPDQFSVYKVAGV